MLFCVVFGVLLFVTQKGIKEKEERARQDQQKIHFINEEIKAIKTDMVRMLEELDQEQLDGALAVMPRIDSGMAEIRKQMEELSEGMREAFGPNLKNMENDIVQLRVCLEKGNAEKCRTVIKKVLNK